MNKFSATLLLLTGALSAPYLMADDVDWPHYGGDLGSSKYAAISQIDASNVSQLQIEWQWDSVDNATMAENIANENFSATPAGWKATPIVVDRVMYIPTSYGRVVALNPKRQADVDV